MHLPFFQSNEYDWSTATTLEARNFVCGYCGKTVSSDKGFPICSVRDYQFIGGGRGGGFQPVEIPGDSRRGGVHICPSCKGPTFFTQQNEQLPGPSVGVSLSHLPPGVDELYEEARRCLSAGCLTAALMCCRKILMNVGVNLDAPTNKTFEFYVDYLVAGNYVPPNAKEWVDHIRHTGNEASHEIKPPKTAECLEVLVFVEALLRNVYELKGRISAIKNP